MPKKFAMKTKRGDQIRSLSAFADEVGKLPAFQRLSPLLGLQNYPNYNHVALVSLLAELAERQGVPIANALSSMLGDYVDDSATPLYGVQTKNTLKKTAVIRMLLQARGGRVSIGSGIREILPFCVTVTPSGGDVRVDGESPPVDTKRFQFTRTSAELASLKTTWDKFQEKEEKNHTFEHILDKVDWKTLMVVVKEDGDQPEESRKPAEKAETPLSPKLYDKIADAAANATLWLTCVSQHLQCCDSCWKQYIMTMEKTGIELILDYVMSPKVFHTFAQYRNYLSDSSQLLSATVSDACPYQLGTLKLITTKPATVNRHTWYHHLDSLYPYLFQEENEETFNDQMEASEKVYLVDKEAAEQQLLDPNVPGPSSRVSRERSRRSRIASDRDEMEGSGVTQLRDRIRQTRLRKVAEVEDDRQRIIRYKQKGGGLELSTSDDDESEPEQEEEELEGDHDEEDFHITTQKDTESTNTLAPPKSLPRRSTRVQRDDEILEFLAEKSRTTDTRLIDAMKQFKEETGCPIAKDTLRKTYQRLKKTIYGSTNWDKNTRIKMMFISGAILSNAILDELRKDADVEVDREGKIRKYVAKDGSLKLEHPQGRSSNSQSQKNDDVMDETQDIDYEECDMTPSSRRRQYSESIEEVSKKRSRVSGESSIISCLEDIKEEPLDFEIKEEEPETARGEFSQASTSSTGRLENDFMYEPLEAYIKEEEPYDIPICPRQANSNPNH